MTIRDATEADLPSIVAIYNAAIPGRTATADTEPVSVAQRLAWFREHDPARRRDGAGGDVVPGGREHGVLVAPCVAAARVHHGDALLDDARDAGLAARAQPDRRALAADAVVRVEVAGAAVGTRERRGEVDADLAALEAGA